ncbi:MAG: hypothetical protein CL846_01635 [Crocinitomicaceae bacterium]|nr:hypothetical protein [Crocinitomicaceae bacterium]|tara:strand:+ start:4271 stop:4744 length:474 start_codon:yes stop_codon:yes gene_type:complete
MIFPEFNTKAKVWLYISSKFLDDNAQQIIFDAFSVFKDTWKSHGDKVNGDLLFMDNYVLVIGANVLDDSMCGRAVDSQVRFIKEMEEKTGFSFMNRQNICLKHSNEINVVPFSNLKSLFDKGQLDKNTLVYNSMIQLNNENIVLPISHSPFGKLIFS